MSLNLSQTFSDARLQKDARRRRTAVSLTLRAALEGVRRLVRYWRELEQAERDRAALLAMSDRELRDIGISRGDILNPARDRASRESAS